MRNNQEIDQLRSGIDTTKITERDLETKIYKMSGENMLKINEKDALIMLFPDLVQALRGQHHDLKSCIRNLTDEETVAKVKSILSSIFGAKLNKLN